MPDNFFPLIKRTRLKLQHEIVSVIRTACKPMRRDTRLCPFSGAVRLDAGGSRDSRKDWLFTLIIFDTISEDGRAYDLPGGSVAKPPRNFFFFLASKTPFTAFLTLEKSL